MVSSRVRRVVPGLMFGWAELEGGGSVVGCTVKSEASCVMVTW